MKKYSWSDLEAENLTPEINRKMLWGQNVMAVRLELAPNTIVPEHEHVSEQVTMVLEGSIKIIGAQGSEANLSPGEVLVIPPSAAHSASVGPKGATVMDIFSPVREDFIHSKPSYYRSESEPDRAVCSEDEIHSKIHSILISNGAQATLDQVKEVSVDILAGYIYEKGLVTMGELRRIMGWDKKRAKAALREWKHGDDHSQSSYEKMLRTQVVLPWERPIGRPKK